MKRAIRSAVNRLGFEIKRKTRSDSSVYDTYHEQSLSERRFYNIGAGAFQHQFWTNVDYATERYAEFQAAPFINYDLMQLKPLPLEENIAEFVYSSHTIEYVSDEAVQNMLAESYRILKPGGGIRLTTPDARLEYEAYRRKDIKLWYWIDWYSQKGSWEHLYKMPLCNASIHQLFLHHFASQLCEIDIDDSPSKKVSDREIQETFTRHPSVKTLDVFTKQCRFNPDHPQNHMNWWTHEKLIALLKEAGFSDPYVSGWGQSIFPPLRDTSLFDTTHPAISLYVEAVR
jgi:predicted SAM-dependent methyltransferase